MEELISRTAAIDTVDEALTGVFVEHRDIAEKMINKIPSVQPETCEDVVSRNEVFNVIEDVAYDVDAGVDSWYGLMNDKVRALQSVRPDRKNTKFEESIHGMFDHIWDCEIDHPAFQETVGDLMTDVIQAFNNSAQPERKKGKWIFLDECSNSGYYCSECNKKVAKEGWSNAVKKIKFCPNCGSDMRGEQDDA